MSISSAIIQYAIPFIYEHGIIISFLGGFITGESIILTLAFLAANGYIPIWYLIVFCTLGMYLSDFIPFLLGRYGLFGKTLKRKWFSKKLKRFDDFLYKYTKHNIFLIILYTKIIYGAAIPALFYLGLKKTSILKFAFCALLVDLIFVPMVITIGWLSGKGFQKVTTIFKDIKIAFLSLIILAILIYLIQKWLSQLLIKKQKQLK